MERNHERYDAIKKAEKQYKEDRERWQHLLDTGAITKDDFNHKINSALQHITDLKTDTHWFYR
jgi:hypothetical protein